MRTRATLAGVGIVLIAAVASAHVTMQPRESAPGATVTYTVRVPTEGTVTTTSVTLEIPENVVVTAADGAEVKKAGERIVSLTWKTEIPPKGFKTFSFTAKNPAAPGELSWKAHQTFADGTSYDWVEPAGSKRPAARTQVVTATAKPAAASPEHKH